MAAGCVSKKVYKCINGPVSPKKAEDIVLLRQQDIPEAFMETPGYRQAWCIYDCYYINYIVLVIMFFYILKSLSLMNCNYKLLQFSK